MKNRKYVLRIFLGILSLVVCCTHVYSTPAGNTTPAIRSPESVTIITICNNQLPYIWNGITCLTAGIYSATLVSSTGADSIAILHLAVINVGNSITNAVICDNQLPYIWNGHSYSSSGTYSVTLTSTSGCDSVPILSLTVNHVVASTTTRTICSSQLPYAWNANNYTAAGTYAITLTSTAGCDSIATLILTVKPVSTSTTNSTVCNNHLPYFWNGHSYAGAGSYAVTLVSSDGCDSVATLNLSVNPVSASSTSITVCNNQLPYSWNGQSFATAGTYPVTLSGSLGCDSVATLVLTVIPVSTSTTTLFICTGQLPFTWNGNTYNTSGTFTANLTGSNGCDSIATLHLVAAAFLTTTINKVICNSELPYSWNGNTYNGSGTFTASFITSTGCDSIATLNLTVIAPYTNSDTLVICQNALPYSWNGHVFTAGGSYQLIPPVVVDACHSYDSLDLIVRPMLPSTTGVSVCSNHLPYVWNGQSYSVAGDYSVSLTSNAGCDSTANLHLLVGPTSTSISNVVICNNQLPYFWNGNNYNTSGSYTATLAGSGGCDSIATLQLTINPVKTSITSTTICSGQVPYSWNGNNYTLTGTYNVTLTSSAGCDSIATLNLIVQAFLNSTSAITVCSNQLPYSWNGNSYPGAGTYPVTLVSSSGCDSVATLKLIVNDVITSVTNVHICTGQLPYSWNGSSYSAGGTYTASLVTTGGCDSIATLQLFVQAVVISQTNIVICNNQLPYNWNGNSYPVAGMYPVTLTSSGGCDSIATLNLVVNEILTSTTNVDICSGQLPYLWNGHSYLSGGTYSVTLTTSGGCDSVPILSLTIVPYTTSSTTLTICSNQVPYSWNGNTYTSGGTYAVLLSGTSVCDSLATLHLSIAAPITSSTAVMACANQLPFAWNGNNYDSAGTYTTVLTSVGGCDSTASLMLSVHPIDSSITNITICNNQLPYAWNGNVYALAGQYSITLTGSSGCDSVATLVLQANPLVTSTTNLTICNNQLPYGWNGNVYTVAGTYSTHLVSSSGCDSLATLNLTTAATLTSLTAVTICSTQVPYTWNGNNYSATGNYMVTLTASSGCDSVATLSLTVNLTSSSTSNATICSNQLPYDWNGTSYSIAGSYSITLTNSGGCDSIATLQLAINPVASSITNISTCSNQLPYHWNGNIYPAAGLYTTTLTAATGCDSIATLNLLVNPVTTSNTNISVCASQLPYSWNGNSYPAPGLYTIVLLSSAGCDSIATLNLQAVNSTNSSTVINLCSNQVPYTWNGQQYSSSGTYMMQLQNSAGCDSIATLNLQIHPVVTSSTVINTCTNQLPYQWNGNQYTAAGIYQVTLTSASGCDSIASLTLNIQPVTFSSSNLATCINQLPYHWNGQLYQAAGLYTVTLTSAAGCDSVATLQLTVNPIDTSRTSTAVCSALLPYNWNGQQYITAGLHTITLTSAAGCDSIAILNLSINITPSLPQVVTPVNYCQYDSTVSLTAIVTSPGSNLLWYTSATGGTGLPTAPTPSAVSAGSTDYYVSQVDPPCEGPRQKITVIINGKPTLGPDVTVKICFNQTANLLTMFNTGGLNSSWTYNQQSVEQVTAAGIAGPYQLIVQSPAGCKDTAVLNLLIQPQVTAYAGPDANAEYNVPFQLLGTGGGNYQWSPADLLNDPLVSNPLATITHDQAFILMVTDDIGCAAYDTVRLRVLDGPTFYVPTAFTPNGDGLNDIFRPTAVGIASLDFFRVFNRYGELVYETNRIGEGWDGVYKGVKQNTGNYVWMIRGTDRTGKVKMMKGNVVLIR